MKSRERVLKAINHEEADRVPLDFGSTHASGIMASVVAKLKQALGLKSAGQPVKVIDGYQMLGEVDEELRQALGIDTVALTETAVWFGFPNTDWKGWTLFDGTEVQVPGLFNTEPDERGDILQYPQGDRTAAASARMPKDGFYFDSIFRQQPIEEEELNPQDNLQEYQVMPDVELERLRRRSEDLRHDSDCAIVTGVAGTSMGGAASVAGMGLKHPKGIRSVEELYISLATRKEYLIEVFEAQCDIALQNLELMRQAVQDNVDIVFITGTDFGAQRNLLIPPDTYREVFKPFHKRMNDWVHRKTSWKTFIHSCGSVEPLIDDFIEAGFDILNPVQTAAARMEPAHLKNTYGDRIAFWGGGVDTQRTLPFGTPDEVRREVQQRLEVFGAGGGFVFNAVHNVQAGVPIENLLAMFDAFKECNEVQGVVRNG